MKKRTSFFLSLIILLAAGGFAFYTGWSQYKVEPGCVGILVSKTGGVNTQPITHDKFSWNWEFLLPTNAKLLEFEPKTYTFNKKIEGVLPSGNEYAKVYNGAADFSYWFSFSVALQSTEEQIVELVKSKEISSQEDLERYLENNALVVCATAVNDVVKAFEEESVQNVAYAQAIINAAAQNNCTNCGLVSITLLQHQFPDYALYLRAKASYNEFISQLEAAAAENAKREAEEKSRFATALQKMESLGETLKKYPELSAVMKNSDSVSKTLELIDSMD